MSRLEELIKRLCPNGVKHMPLKEIAEFRRGSFPQPYTNTLWYGGNNCMPFVQVADMLDDKFYLVEKTKQTISEIAQTKSVFVEADTVLVSLQGTIGRVAITQYDCFVDRTIAIFTKFKVNNLNKKYFAYALKQKFDIEKKYARGSTLKTITKEEFSEFTIPIPPIEVQCEVARILDELTKLRLELTEELTEELLLRRKQYEYYREQLLTYGNNCSLVTIGEVVEKITTINWNKCSNTKKYIDLTSVDRDTNSIIDELIRDVSAENAPSRARQLVNCGDILFGGTRPMLKRFCIIPKEYDKQICSTGYIVLRVKNNVVLKEYLYHIIGTERFYNYVEINQQGTSYPAIGDKVLKQYTFALPNLNEQEGIIKILNKFEKLCKEIIQRLDSEIEARRNQYEFYKEKLLRFKELEK